MKDKTGREIKEGDWVQVCGYVTGSVGLKPGFFWNEDDIFQMEYNPKRSDDLSIKLFRPIQDFDDGCYHNQAMGLIAQGDCEVIFSNQV